MFLAEGKKNFFQNLKITHPTVKNTVASAPLGPARFLCGDRDYFRDSLSGLFYFFLWVKKIYNTLRLGGWRLKFLVRLMHYFNEFVEESD